MAKRERKGLLITFEGTEGSGKSIQTEFLANRLRLEGLNVVSVREPGGTVISEQVRNITHNPDNTMMAPTTEALLFIAARAQIVAEVIKPALEQNKIVICDRYVDSTLAYQGYGRGLEIAALKRLNNFATLKIVPDLTLFFDMPVEEGLKRRARTGEIDRLDMEMAAFYEAAREGYFELIKENPKRWVVINVTGSIERIRGKVWSTVEPLLRESYRVQQLRL